MPTVRTKLKRKVHTRITSAAIDAWRRCDYLALHAALGLMPCDCSPLPQTVTPLGVDPDHRNQPGIMDDSWEFAVNAQRQLYELSGPPDTDALRREYQRNLDEDEGYLNYLKQPRHPNCHEPEEKRKANIAGWEKRVAWRRELLEGLPCASP